MILAQTQIERLQAAGDLSAWARDAFEELCAKVGDAAFPCTFGTTALRAGEIRFAFIESTDEAACLDALVETLAEYARFVAGEPIVRASMQPLAVLLPPPPEWRSVEDYYENSWRWLAAVHGRDPDPWPARIPADPDDPGWSFCFAGVPLFINFKTPLHQGRRSRRTRNSYVWLVQARDGFDVVAGNTPRGRHARQLIRDKLSAYDDVAVYPALGHYGSPRNREWKQYFVPESNEPITGRCPFTNRSRDGR